MLDWLRYEWRIIRTAGHASRARWQSNALKPLTFVLLLAFLALTLGGETAQIEWHRALLGLAAGALAIVLLFLWDNSLAPYRIFSKQREDIQRLNAELDRRTSKRLLVSYPYTQSAPIRRGIALDVGLFIKFKVQAAGPALRNCRARVTAMRFEDGRGEVLHFDIDDPITLVTGTSAHDSVQLDHDVAIAFDVAVCDAATNTLRFWPETVPQGIGLRECFKIPATYWLDIQVSADEAPTEKSTFGIKWTGRLAELQLVQPPE